LIRRVVAGGSNIRSVGNEAATQSLRTVLEALSSDSAAAAVCIGAAGVGREADLREFETMVRALLPRAIGLRVCSDAQIVLRAATDLRPAMAVIAGTGSLVYAEGPRGDIRAGGYGAVIGDPGSGYAIGLAAIQATAAALDLEQAMNTPLANAVMSALDVRSEERIMLLLLDCPEYAYSFFGAIQIGAVPIPTSTLFKPTDYEYILNDSRARVVVISEALLPQLQAIPRERLRYLRDIVVVGNPPTGIHGFADLIAPAPPELEAVRTYEAAGRGRRTILTKIAQLQTGRT